MDVLDHDCSVLYYIFLAVFGVAEVIMTIMGMKEQVPTFAFVS